MTLTREARVDRTAFYGSRPYSQLRAEFERRRQALQQAGDIPDLCEAQIVRLKVESTKLRERLTRSGQTINELMASAPRLRHGSSPSTKRPSGSVQPPSAQAA
ncbi:hypothetical protein [Streptomyces sparsogenes]|uniref:Uncharacterized protein n=1 Tax=Streptomyces sparsogenes DSM 40356 TaxID=1331668 RepID=A0A1R1SFR6_9ACTN|nr:hypothetical protein [Streptomyces sparsogenes]OMI37076.1 hypothetical protein SPAR_23229 [Streptomyces sparsogenes DSM 40356]